MAEVQVTLGIQEEWVREGGSSSSFNSIRKLLGTPESLSIEFVDKIENPEIQGEINAEYKPSENKVLISKSIKNTENLDAVGIQYKTTAGMGLNALVAHELAHVKDGGWARNISGSKEMNRLFLDRKTEALDGNYSRVLSKLALSNPSELYAEAIAVYSVNPKLLQNTDSELYEFVQKTL